MSSRMDRLELVRSWLGRGFAEPDACRLVGVSVAWYRRWTTRIAEAGLDAAGDLPRTGRPSLCPDLTAEERDYLARLYLRSNRGRSSGSLTASARIAARDPNAPLRQEVRDAILRPKNKHAIPTAVKRAMRSEISAAHIARYRDPKSGQNDGIYIPGYLRMTSDGKQRIKPGERQVWDDASINIAYTVPWPAGGDPCSDKFGVRLARYQLLLGIDCATDMCVGYSNVMRANDGYRACDVVAALHRCWERTGYAPNEVVLEGGSWQAKVLPQFLTASGVQMISAKGRPNQKLVEGYFNRLWTAMSIFGIAGHVGRFRGENVTETQLWTACREGRRDPRTVFPTMETVLGWLNQSIAHLNAEKMQSKLYGEWVPKEVYAAATEKGHTLPGGVWRFALPVCVERTMRRGMVEVLAETPFDSSVKHPYLFAPDNGYMFEGAKVTVRFDPYLIERGAHIELADRWHERPKGHEIAEAAPCISSAPVLIDDEGRIQAYVADPRESGMRIKKANRALIGTQTAAFDDRGLVRKPNGRPAKEQKKAVVRPVAQPKRVERTPVVQDFALAERLAGLSFQ